MATKKILAFGCEDAALITPGTTPIYTDIPGIQEAEFAVEVDKTEVLGDDDLLATWYHSPKATVTLKAAVLDLDILEAVTGNPVESVTGGYAIPVLTENDLNPPEVSLRLKLKARAYGDGSLQTLKMILYRVVFSPPKFTGIKGGEAFGVELEGAAYKADKDEKLNDLTLPARARIEIEEV